VNAKVPIRSRTIVWLLFHFQDGGLNKKLTINIDDLKDGRGMDYEVLKLRVYTWLNSKISYPANVWLVHIDVLGKFSCIREELKQVYFQGFIAMNLGR